MSDIETVLPHAMAATEHLREASLTYLAETYAADVPSGVAFLGLVGAFTLFHERMQVIYDAVLAGGTEAEIAWLLGHSDEATTPWKVEFQARVKAIRDRMA